MFIIHFFVAENSDSAVDTISIIIVTPAMNWLAGKLAGGQGTTNFVAALLYLRSNLSKLHIQHCIVNGQVSKFLMTLLYFPYWRIILYAIAYSLND